VRRTRWEIPPRRFGIKLPHAKKADEKNTSRHRPPGKSALRKLVHRIRRGVFPEWNDLEPGTVQRSKPKPSPDYARASGKDGAEKELIVPGPDHGRRCRHADPRFAIRSSAAGSDPRARRTIRRCTGGATIRDSRRSMILTHRPLKADANELVLDRYQPALPRGAFTQNERELHGAARTRSSRASHVRQGEKPG
jgi:hypothetical protein